MTKTNVLAVELALQSALLEQSLSAVTARHKLTNQSAFIVGLARQVALLKQLILMPDCWQKKFQIQKWHIRAFLDSTKVNE